jgi:hypothetical protein
LGAECSDTLELWHLGSIEHFESDQGATSSRRGPSWAVRIPPMRIIKLLALSLAVRLITASPAIGAPFSVDQAWVRAQVPAEMASSVDRGMETVRFRVAEKDMQVIFYGTT